MKIFPREANQALRVTNELLYNKINEYKMYLALCVLDYLV